MFFSKLSISFEKKCIRSVLDVSFFHHVVFRFLVLKTCGGFDTPALLTIFSTPVQRGFDSEFAYKVLISLYFSPYISGRQRCGLLHPKHLESTTGNQSENPLLKHLVNSPVDGDSVFSSARSTDEPGQPRKG